jgi:hypothetical protein
MTLIDRLKAAAIARRAVPLFPVLSFSPTAPSAFKGTPPEYTVLVCMTTHRTGAWMERVAHCDDRGERPAEVEAVAKKHQPKVDGKRIQG